ncbi:MAG TPA: 1-acyl-sn-glycerol-3-phosphate acyltransferase, partial [Spirochaetia bacterium]|nr:1-acyl-sn-glycerol-3-phosphate acyltransferase [Spirochaetia bacterium]
PSTGTPIRRVRRIEQASWDRIYREDIGDIASLCPLDRALADRIALETSLTMRHLQLADIMVYLSELAIPDGASIDEMAEAAANLAGVVARLEGGDISATPRLGSRSITYRIGEPISVSSRWEAYRENRQQAVDELMHSLRGEFQRLSSPGKTATEGRSL